MRRSSPLRGLGQQLAVFEPDPTGQALKTETLPELPEHPLVWCNVARPMVGRFKRDITHLPFWCDILLDRHHDVMVVAGRQTFKTTVVTDLIGWIATTGTYRQVLCAVDSGDRHIALKQKLRVDMFEANPDTLKKYPRYGTGNENEISMANHSTIYTQFTTEKNKYKKMEGKSPNLVLLDEAQYQPVEDLHTLEETLAMTHAPLWLTGIGGEAGSPYQSKWLESDRRKWEYDDPHWRRNLRFDANGLVVDDYLRDVLRGRWIPQAPENSEHRHGYHLPQAMHPYVPLTVQDAVRLYKIAPKFSIEHKRRHYSKMQFATHVLAEHYRSARRPITFEMIQACMEPYAGLHLLSPAEVRSAKKRHRDALTVCFGVDWGSGPSASSTVFAVLLYWKPFDIYQLTHLDVRPAENLHLQALAATRTMSRYNCDIGVADLGYGAHQVKIMQHGGRDPRTDREYKGLGSARLLGCRTLSAVLSSAKPFQFHADSMDEHGDITPSLRVSKTAAIDEYIAAVEMLREHPGTSYAPRGSRPRLIIPYAEPEAVMILHRESVLITRKDIDVDAEAAALAAAASGSKAEDDIRQFATKEYNHPPDAVMAVTYAMLANLHRNFAARWHYVGIP